MNNLTRDGVLSEIRDLRSTCEHADLLLERFQRRRDEYAHACADCPYDAAVDHKGDFEEALEELEELELDECPPAVGFADRTIFAEVASTRASLAEAKRECLATLTRMKEKITSYPMVERMVDRGRGDDGAMLAEQMQGFFNAGNGAEAAAAPPGVLPPEMQLD